MIHTFSIQGESVDFSLRDKPHTTRSLLPSLEFLFLLQNRGSKLLWLSNFSFKFYVESKRGQRISLNYMGFEKQLIELKFRSNELLRANIILDPFSLEKIEELRADGDFKYYISGSLIGEISSPQGVLSRELVSGIQYSDSVSRSDWVEQYLANFDFKRVRLVEIPILSLEESRSISEYLDSAWRQKHMGHYDNTLTDCRKALEETRRVIQSKGFINENLERRDKTDWKRYLDSDSIGEILGNIEQQLYRFTSIAAHLGKAINIEDADYALLITHATINYLKKGLNASI